MHLYCIDVLYLCNVNLREFMMKEFKKEKILPLEVEKSKIWMIFDILRSENISSDDYHVVLFLLSSFKDNLFSVDLVNGNNHIKERLIEQLRSSNNELSKEYAPIFQSFEPSIQNLSENGIRQLLNMFTGINKLVLTENFPEVFDSFLYRISESQGRYAGEFIQPIELTRFICTLSDLKKDAKVFNPFAGLASFGVCLEQTKDYFGQELNQKTWALGTLRLMAYGRLHNSKYVCDDSISHWPSQSEKFDLIISNPPFRIKLQHQIGDIETKYKTIEPFLIENGFNSLNQNGKLITLLPIGFLFEGVSVKKLRRRLLEDDLIDTIILLPGGILLNTGMPSIILVLSKIKKYPGEVKLVNAENYTFNNSVNEKILNESNLSRLILNDVTYSNNVIRMVSIEEIREDDYNLYIPRYFRKKFFLPDIEAFVELRSILKKVKCKRTNLPKIGKIVSSSDLKDDRIDFMLDLSSIKATEITQSNVAQISESCLLLSSNLKPLKPTIFEYKGEPIYVQGVQYFKIKESIVDKSYLINELHNDYVNEQIVTFNMGSTMYFSDLMEVTIKFPSLEEQRAKVNGILEFSDEFRKLKNKFNSNILEESNSIYKKNSSLKHRLGTPLLNIGSSLRNIEKALSREFFSWEETKLNERYSITLRESYDSIHQTLKTVHQILIANENEIDFSNKRFEEIDFIAFIKGYINSIKSAEKSNVNTKLDIHPDIKSQFKNKVLILANAELLEIGLNTIVENANKHAFTDDFNKYKLEFIVSLSVAPSIKKESDDTIGRFDTYIKVEVANNGKPFPKNYSLEKLIRKNSFAGETGNTGLGGFDLNEIIKFHNNGISTLELITDDYTTEFTTSYSFLLPLNR